MRSKRFKTQQGYFWITVVLYIVTTTILYTLTIDTIEIVDDVVVIARAKVFLGLFFAHTLSIGVLHRWGVNIVLEEYFYPFDGFSFDTPNCGMGKKLISTGLIGVTILLLFAPIAFAFLIKWL